LFYVRPECGGRTKHADRSTAFASSDGTEWVEGTFSSATVDQLKAVKPDLKVVGAFGGWNLDSGFAKAASEGKIEELAQAIVDFKDDNKL
jgi:GH18 family chitinase